MASSILRRNIPYIKQQITAAFGNSSVVVKFFCVTIFSCYFLSFARSAIEIISVTPGYVLPPSFWIWTIFTYCFLEMHIWVVLVDIVVVVLCGKLIEPLWGAMEMLTFFALVNIGVALLSTTFYLIVYMIAMNVEYLFDVHIHGLTGYVAGVCVAVKQTMPDHILLVLPIGKLRNRHIPLLLLFLAVLFKVIRLIDGVYPCMFTTGMLCSWVYLRFYQRHSNGSKGDLADNFTFASFFPDVIQPFIAVLANTVFHFLVKIWLCKKAVRRYDVGAPSSITISLPGTDPQDAERRRQIALKALNERLSKAEPTTTWPVLVDEPKSPAADKDLQETKMIIAEPHHTSISITLPMAQTPNS